MRPFGEILLEMEQLLDEMVDGHDVQVGDILNLVHGHLQIHRPDAFEEYEGTDDSPIFYYGPKERK